MGGGGGSFSKKRVGVGLDPAGWRLLILGGVRCVAVMQSECCNAVVGIS